MPAATLTPARSSADAKSLHLPAQWLIQLPQAKGRVLKMDIPKSRPNRPKSRQSIAHVTTSKDLDFDKENATADFGSIRKRKLTGSDHERKKLRSKSLGPGGLEALTESAGNATKVNGSHSRQSIFSHLTCSRYLQCRRSSQFSSPRCH